MPYRFLEDVSIADVAFVAEGETLEELFEAAALATTSVMVRDVEKVKPTVEREIELEAEDLEQLLFSFLQEVVYYKDADLLLFSRYDVAIHREEGGYRLRATLCGEKLDMHRHELMADVKAVTMHRFEVKRVGEEWRATVVLDV